MKNFVGVFIPPICRILWGLIQGVKGYFLLWNNKKVQYNSHQGESLIILGNGPSLKKSMEQHLEKMKNCDCMAVNFFANTDSFKEVRPQSYLLVDPAFFQDLQNLSDNLMSKVRSLISNFVENVYWDMVLYLPIHAKESSLTKELKKNNHIKFVYFNSKGYYDGQLSPSLRYWLWNHNFIAPLGQTVLNSCLTLGITMHYSNIYLVGADTSWHEDYWMDQKTNDLYTKDKHFYGEEKIRLYKDAAHNYPTRIHEEFQNVSKALESYWILAEYATYNKVKVYNASEYSWIDAFERKTL